MRYRICPLVPLQFLSNQSVRESVAQFTCSSGFDWYLICRACNHDMHVPGPNAVARLRRVAEAARWRGALTAAAAADLRVGSTRVAW